MVDAGDTIAWHSDVSAHRDGWTICLDTASRAPSATPSAAPTVAAPTYIRMSVGNCDGSYAYIRTAEECLAAAQSIPGLVATAVNTAFSELNPHGCYWRGSSTPGSQLYFNSNGALNVTSSILGLGLILNFPRAPHRPHTAANTPCALLFVRFYCL